MEREEIFQAIKPFVKHCLGTDQVNWDDKFIDAHPMAIWMLIIDIEEDDRFACIKDVFFPDDFPKTIRDLVETLYQLYYSAEPEKQMEAGSLAGWQVA